MTDSICYRPGVAWVLGIALTCLMPCRVVASADSTSPQRGSEEVCFFEYFHCLFENCGPGLARAGAAVDIEPAPQGSSGIDVAAILHFRRTYMQESVAGQRIIGLHHAHLPEVVTLVNADEALRLAGLDMSRRWSSPVQVLMMGFGIEARVDAPMAASVDTFFTRMETIGSGDLAAAVAAERAQHPPVSSWVGMNMDQFVDTMFVSDVQFRDGLEAP